MSNINDFVIENGVLKKYTGTDSDVIIPDSVAVIGWGAFKECKNFTSVTIPDSVTKIGACAFEGCKNLTSVTIPDSVTEIGYCAFSGCAGLQNADGFIIVKNILFEYTGSDTDVTIPDGVTEIGACAFDGCKKLKSVIIPDSVTEIKFGAFYGCKNLMSASIPDCVTKIGDSAFNGCKKLNIRLSGRPTLGKNTFTEVLSIIAQKMSVAKFSDTEDKKAATRAFLSNIPFYTDSVIAEDYKKYAIAQRKKLLPDIFNEDNAEALVFYADNKKITIKNFDEEYFIPAEKHKAQNCIAFLLDWKNRNITEADI